VFLLDGRSQVRNVYSVGLLDATLVLTDLRTLLLESAAHRRKGLTRPREQGVFFRRQLSDERVLEHMRVYLPYTSATTDPGTMGGRGWGYGGSQRSQPYWLPLQPHTPAARLPGSAHGSIPCGSSWNGPH